MTAQSSRRMSGGGTKLIVGTVILTSVALTSCRENDYLGRRDTISLGAGDAAASNRVVHMKDPWPRYAKNKNINVDGKRMSLGVERYQKNESLEPVGSDTTERFKDEDAPKGPPPEGGPKSP